MAHNGYLLHLPDEFLFLIETFQVWHMLEIVCIKFSALYNFIWLHIVIKHCHFQLISFFFRIDFACSNISACGVADAATLIVFASSLLPFSSAFELLWHPVSTPNVKIPVNIIAVTFSYSLSFSLLFLLFFYFLLSSTDAAFIPADWKI